MHSERKNKDTGTGNVFILKHAKSINVKLKRFIRLLNLFNAELSPKR